MSMSNTTIAAQAKALSASIETILVDAADTVDEETVQTLASSIVRLFATKVTQDGNFPIVPQSTITATDAMLVTSALLRAVNVQVFELGLWQSWANNAERAPGPIAQRGAAR
jgi:hypothetical protein